MTKKKAAKKPSITIFSLYRDARRKAKENFQGKRLREELDRCDRQLAIARKELPLMREFRETPKCNCVHGPEGRLHKSTWEISGVVCQHLKHM